MTVARVPGIKRWVVILSLLVTLLLAPAALAQDGPTQDQVNAVARKLYCPVCENTPLDVCPTQACQNWRDEIQVALVEGKSEREILDDFARKYGDSVLAEPPPRQVVAWALPVVLVLAGVGAMVYWLRSWTRPEAATAPLPVDEGPGMIESDPYLQKLEQELAEWE